MKLTHKILIVGLILIGMLMLVGGVQGATYLSAYDGYLKLNMKMNASPFIDETGKTITNIGTVTANTTFKHLGAASAQFIGTNNLSLIHI